MSDREIQRYRQTLRRNRIWLEKFLDDPNRLEHDLHLLVVARLRVLLDPRSDGPALIDYAEKVGLKDALRVTGPYEPNHGQVYPLKDARWLPPGSHDDDPPAIPIEDFLEMEAGEWSVWKDLVGFHMKYYTPMDLIRWLANSEAVHHLPYTAGPTKRARGARRYAMPAPQKGFPEPDDIPNRNEEFVAEGVFALGAWAAQAIQYVLQTTTSE